MKCTKLIGVVVSDCGAVKNACAGNYTTPGLPRDAPSNPPPPPRPPGFTNFTVAEQCYAAAGAAAVIAGTDMNCVSPRHNLRLLVIARPVSERLLVGAGGSLSQRAAERRRSRVPD